MFINNFNPIAIQVFSLEIRWYSLAYIVGILIGWILGKKIFISNSDIKEKFDDYITYLIIGIIIGGRLGYVLFYNFNYYSENIHKIFFIWEGGMSFHGALIGIMIGLFFISIKEKIKFLNLTDFIVIYVPIGLFLGRIGNFINSELYGSPTESGWGVIFPLIDDAPRHPSMLYEALLEGLILFYILLMLSKFKQKQGVLTSSFLIIYSVFRSSIELVRVPDIQIGYLYSNWLTMGMILSLPMFLAGITLLYFSIKGRIR